MSARLLVWSTDVAILVKKKSEKKRTEMLADEEMVVKMEDREDSML